METNASFAVNILDANSNFIGSSPHESKSLIEFEHMFEKEDFSRDRKSDFDAEIKKRKLFSNDSEAYKTNNNNNEKFHINHGDVNYDIFGNFGNLFENEKSQHLTKERPDETFGVASDANFSRGIYHDNQTDTGPGNTIVSSADSTDEKSTVPMSSTSLHMQLKRAISNDSKNPFKVQSTKKDQLVTGSSETAAESQKREVHRTELDARAWMDSDAVVPINSSTLHGELRRAIKEGNRLKENNQQYELRNMELQGEVLEMSRMAAHFEAKSERSSSREDELRNELNTAIKRAAQSRKEAEMCRNKVALLEGLFVESEKRQSMMKQKLEEAERKIKLLDEQNGYNEVAYDELKEKTAILEAMNEAAVQPEVGYNVDPQNEGHEDDESNLRGEHIQPSTSNLGCYNVYEGKEYRYLIDALKQQLSEANAINKRYAAQVKHQLISIEKLKQENVKLQGDIKEARTSDKGRKSKAFLYLQQYRESQVKMQAVQSELKKQRAENDDLNIRYKWMKIELERLKSALTSKRNSEETGIDNAKESKVTGRNSKKIDNRGTMRGEDAKIIENATNLVEERMKLARSKSRSNEKHGAQSQQSEAGMEQAESKGLSHATGNRNDYNVLRDQHEKLSIEMALTRNTVKKLEGDNSELRRQISLLKAEIALGVEEAQQDGFGGVIPGKYRRGNFEVVSKPAFGQINNPKSRRTQSMSAFRVITGRNSHGSGSLEAYDKAQSLIDLSKLSIDEMDERRSSLKKHSSEGEKIFEYFDVEDDDGSQFVEESKAVVVEGQGGSFGATSSREVSHLQNFVDKSRYNEVINEMSSGIFNSNNRHLSIGKSVKERPTHTTLHSTISFPHTDEVSNFGNFKKIESTPTSFHSFKVPGILRASPAAKSFNSIMHASNEITRKNDTKQSFDDEDE